MKNRFQLVVLTVLCIVLVVIDQFTKNWAQAHLESGSRPIIGDLLSLRLVHNPGAAFSFGHNTTWIFSIIALVVCIALPFVIQRSRRMMYRFVLAVIWAGALGNLIDRLVREPGFGQGHVVDFIDYAGFFVGNIADIYLVVGVIALVLMELRATRSEDTESSESSCKGSDAGASSDGGDVHA